MNTQVYSEERQRPASGLKALAANSILVADCGTVFTKVSLFGLVEGQYRLMARGEAPTTITLPYGDITKGVIQAINRIEFITGRHFVTNGQIISPEQPTGDGADIFITTISAAGPMRIVLLGAAGPASELLARQAVSGLYTEMHALPSPSYQASTMLNAGSSSRSNQPIQGLEQWTPERTGMEWEQQIARMREIQPHLAVIVGMADGPAGPTPLQEACQLLLNMTQLANGHQMNSAQAQVGEHQPTVLYAGAPQYVEATRQMLQGSAEVTPIDPLISQAQLSSASMASGALYERDVMQLVPGYDRLQSWSTAAPVATATSLSSLVRFLAQHYAMNVTTLDIGGATTTIMQAGEGGEFIPMVNYGIGVGSSLGAIFQQSGFLNVARWLPFDIAEDNLRQYVMNRMLHPHVISTTQKDLQISHAFAREALLLTMEAIKRLQYEWFSPDLILATGGVLAHAPKYGQVALMLLDALQPQGVTSLVLDRTMLISQLGAVAAVAPLAAVQVNENDAVTHRLGTCVIPFGMIQPGELAVRVGLEYTNGRQVTVDVMGGTIEIIPLQTHEQALLTLFPAQGVDVGLGPGERARAAEEIDGGLIGLIIDARGRPLVLPSNSKERQTRLIQWMQAIGAW